MEQVSWVDSGHVRSPTESVKTEWTEDGWHKIQGQLLFTPNFSYQERSKMGPSGPIWGVRVPDLSTLIFSPEIEFICDIWTSNVVPRGIVNQRGEHPIKLYAAIYTPEQFSRRTISSATPLAVYRDERKRPPSFKQRGAFGITIEPDSGQYVIEWSITRDEHSGTRDRQPSGSVEGFFTWDSNSDLLRMRLTSLHNSDSAFAVFRPRERRGPALTDIPERVGRPSFPFRQGEQGTRGGAWGAPRMGFSHPELEPFRAASPAAPTAGPAPPPSPPPASP